MFRSPNDPRRVFVDIWRVEKGNIVEHWDIIQPIPEAGANGNGMAYGHGSTYASAKAPEMNLPSRSALLAQELLA